MSEAWVQAFDNSAQAGLDNDGIWSGTTDGTDIALPLAETVDYLIAELPEYFDGRLLD